MNLTPFQSKKSEAPALRALSRLQRDFNQAFQNLFENSPVDVMDEVMPFCDLSEDDNAYTARFDMPGVPKESIKIETDSHHLTVSSERREEKKEASKRHPYSEIYYGAFERTLTFASAIDEAKTKASYENGVLTITMPKTEKTQKKKIAIQ